MKWLLFCRTRIRRWWEITVKTVAVLAMFVTVNNNTYYKVLCIMNMIAIIKIIIIIIEGNDYNHYHEKLCKLMKMWYTTI